MAELKPKVFVGSSSEGLEVAQAIQYQLQNDAEVVLWKEGVFALSYRYLETLVNTVGKFDYGIFVLRSDDTLVSRESEFGTSRGNVLFELGMFFSHLGRSRTFVVYDSSARPAVISDLHGVSFTPYDGSRTSDILSTIGPACFSIRQELRNWERRVGVRSHDNSNQRAELDELREELHRTKDELAMAITKYNIAAA
jgi:predicted nucleotide-binding protein